MFCFKMLHQFLKRVNFTTTLYDKSPTNVFEHVDMYLNSCAPKLGTRYISALKSLILSQPTVVLSSILPGVVQMYSIKDVARDCVQARVMNNKKMKSKSNISY